MTAEIVVFYGEEVNIEQAKKLHQLCADKLLQNYPLCDILITWDKTKDVTGKKVVCPVDVRLLGSPAGRVTYSADDNSADIVAINVQKHTDYISFELMSADHMGRVFIDNSKNISAADVLVVAAVMYAAGVPLKRVISAVNSILKN